MTGAFEILDPGWATTVQDAGRLGLAHLGVPAGGTVDPGLASLVNRLLGNPPGAAVLETCGHLRIRAVSALLVAASHELAPVSLAAGETYLVPPATGGRLWHYLGVRGGIDVEPVLGSRSTDTLSGLGPPHPAAGQQLAVGPEPRSPVGAELAPLPPPADSARLSPGPRSDWFGGDWRRLWAATAWRITATSRVGVRFSGATFERVVDVELASEGLVRGAVQVPPDGSPVMLLADHPTTGGYPVIAVVHPDDVSLVAQHPAGTHVRFRWIGGGGAGGGPGGGPGGGRFLGVDRV